MRSLTGILVMTMAVLFLAMHHELSFQKAHAQVGPAPSREYRLAVQVADRRQDNCTVFVEHPGDRPRPRSPEPWMFKAEGQARTEKEALREAIRDAQAQLALELARAKPDTRYNPPTELVQRLVRNKKFESKYYPAPVDATLYTARLELELTPEVREDLLRNLRMEDAAERQLSLAKWGFGLVAALGVIAGYYRLDDRTKGYYTNWLRAGAAVALTLTGIVIARLL